MSRKVSRRNFARTSLAAGAAAAAATFPATLLGGSAAAKAPLPASGAAASGAAAARRRRVALPPEVAYGGRDSTGRDMMLDTTAFGRQTATHPGGWREGTTIPAEYYLDEKHYLNDERFVADHFWLMADHENRVPKPGDYFVFEYGRGDSVIICRDQAGAVQAFHNVCRHRGSRLAQHGFDNIHPAEARADGKPTDPRLSVVQLGPSGNTPVFRCPYHAWTYDLTGRLISTPQSMPDYFDVGKNGLHPCHVRTVEGFIFINLSHQEPPDFDTFVTNWRAACQEYGTAQLKTVARRQYPTKANWKLAVENFRECYHCGPSHTKSYYWVHQLQFLSEMNAAERARVEQALAREGHAMPIIDERRRQDRATAATRQAAGGGGMGAGNSAQHLRPGYVSGSLDGKPVAPLLPSKKEFTHFTRYAATGFSTSYLQAYDDHVAVARFTPRGIMSTDVEIFWMVNPAAKEKDVDVDRMIALWDLTYREDRWIVENNHLGLQSGHYSSGFYAPSEGGPASFIKWYMTEVVPSA
jgi:phenylpropionate dioxygenase-like ring-hydroxylating dioxygenase large terminal subunit